MWTSGWKLLQATRSPKTALVTLLAIWDYVVIYCCMAKDVSALASLNMSLAVILSSQQKQCCNSTLGCWGRAPPTAIHSGSGTPLTRMSGTVFSGAACHGELKSRTWTMRSTRLFPSFTSPVPRTERGQPRAFCDRAQLEPGFQAHVQGPALEQSQAPRDLGRKTQRDDCGDLSG